LIQLIQIRGLGSEKWGGGHYDHAKGTTHNAIVHDLGQLAGVCGCYGGATEFIK